MKALIQVAISGIYEQPFILGYIESIRYKFITDALQGKVNYKDKWGDVDIDKMFKCTKKSCARVYDDSVKAENDTMMLRKMFTGLHYMFRVVPINNEDAANIRKMKQQKRK